MLEIYDLKKLLENY